MPGTPPKRSALELAGEGQRQSVRLLAAPVWALCPKNTRDQKWGVRGWRQAGRGGGLAAPLESGIGHKGRASWLRDADLRSAQSLGS